MALTLAQDGSTEYTIVVGNDAIEPEKHGGQELGRFLQQVTGACFPTHSDVADIDNPKIFVGPSAALGKTAPHVSLEGIGKEGIVITTHGRDLILAGGRPRGTLYAVYAFLEDHVGCRWYSPSVSRIPSSPTLSVEPINYRYVPVLEYRDPFAFIGFDADWAARNKSNGHRTRLDSTRGGKTRYVGFVHTLARDFVSPGDYFDEHPEDLKERLRSIPMGRLGDPQDYVGAAIFLASRASDFVTGQTVFVDGGSILV